MMHERYSKEIFRYLWSDGQKVKGWAEIDLAYLRARSEAGEVNETVYCQIRDALQLTDEAWEKLAQRAKEIDRTITGHDYVAFVMAVHEILTDAGVGEWKHLFHEGLTTYDPEDSALVKKLRRAFEYIIMACTESIESLRVVSERHKYTLMMLTTHGQDAEPGTFGKRLRDFMHELIRARARMLYVLNIEFAEGKIAGATGIHASVKPELEAKALSFVGLRAARSETQILSRDRHAMAMSVLAITASTVGRIARTLWQDMRSDARRIEEFRAPTKHDSSRMPHKRNPNKTEQLWGLPRAVRAALMVALENMEPIEERDISQSCCERLIFPDATAYTHYLLVSLKSLIETMVVHEERMRERLEEGSFGVWAASRVWTALTDRGFEYEVAYQHVRGCAHQAVDTETNLRLILQQAIIEGDGRTALEILGADAFDECFNIRSHVAAGVEHAFG